MQEVVKLIDSNTGEVTSYYPITEFEGGGAVTDADVDGVIIRKKGDTYYKRAFTGPVNVKWFGAKGDGVTDDSAAIQAAVNSGFDVTIPLSSTGYKISVTITIIKEGITLFGNKNKIFLSTDKGPRLLSINANNVTINDLIFSGNGLQPLYCLASIEDNILNTHINSCVFEDMLGTNWGSNALNQMYGLMVSPYATQNTIIDKCVFRNFKKHNDLSINPSPAPLLGYVGGIFIYNGSTPSIPSDSFASGSITNCSFQDIITLVESGLGDGYVDLVDADAIRVYSVTGGPNIFKFVVDNCKFHNIQKRCVKLSGGGLCQGFRVYNTLVTADDNLPYPMVCALKADTDTIIDGVILKFSSLARAGRMIVQIQGYENQQIRNIEADFIQTGFEISPVASTTSYIDNLVIQNVKIGSYTQDLILQAGSSVQNQKNIFVDNLKAKAELGSTKAGITIGKSLDTTCGATLSNINVINCGLNLPGDNLIIKDVSITIDDATYVGVGTTSSLIQIGSISDTLLHNIQGLTINIKTIPDSFLTTNRFFIYTRGSGYSINNLNFTANTTIVAYPHICFTGTNNKFTNINYNGDGTIAVGGPYSLSNSSLSNFKRNSANSIATPFLSSTRTGNNYNVYSNIFDYPTNTASSLLFTNSTRTILNGLYHNSTNTNPVDDTALTTPVSKSNIVKFV